MINNLLLLLQPPSSPTHPHVLYYTVSHNVSGNGSELAFNTTTNEAILPNEASYGETYYFSVCAVNDVGKGKVEYYTISFDNGKKCMFAVWTIIISYSQESRLSVGCLQQSVQVVLDHVHLMLLEKEKLKITQYHSKIAWQ